MEFAKPLDTEDLTSLESDDDIRFTASAPANGWLVGSSSSHHGIRLGS